MILDLETVRVSLNKRTILHDVSLSASAGEFVGLIGPNGAGKSTLLKTAAGLLPLDAGACRINGASINSLPVKARARSLSCLPQARPLYWALDARGVAALGRFAFGNPLTEDARDREAVDRALTRVGAAHLGDRLASELSGGELSRVHLARALAGEAPLLLADEPAAALDPAHQFAVMQLLRAIADEGKTVIAALHDLPIAARYCTRLVALEEGRIRYDGAADAVPDEIYEEIFRVKPQKDAAGRLVSFTPLHAS